MAWRHILLNVMSRRWQTGSIVARSTVWSSDTFYCTSTTKLRSEEIIKTICCAPKRPSSTSLWTDHLLFLTIIRLLIVEIGFPKCQTVPGVLPVSLTAARSADLRQPCCSELWEELVMRGRGDNKHTTNAPRMCWGAFGVSLQDQHISQPAWSNNTSAATP